MTITNGSQKDIKKNRKVHKLKAKWFSWALAIQNKN